MMNEDILFDNTGGMFDTSLTDTQTMDASQVQEPTKPLAFSNEQVQDALNRVTGNTVAEKVENAKNLLLSERQTQTKGDSWETMSKVEQWKSLQGESPDQSDKNSPFRGASNIDSSGDTELKSMAISKTLPIKHADEFKKAKSLNPDLLIDEEFQAMERLARKDWATYYSPSPEARAKRLK